MFFLSSLLLIMLTVADFFRLGLSTNSWWDQNPSQLLLTLLKFSSILLQMFYLLINHIIDLQLGMGGWCIHERINWPHVCLTLEFCLFPCLVEWKKLILAWSNEISVFTRIAGLLMPDNYKKFHYWQIDSTKVSNCHEISADLLMRNFVSSKQGNLFCITLHFALCATHSPMSPTALTVIHALSY